MVGCKRICFLRAVLLCIWLPQASSFSLPADLRRVDALRSSSRTILNDGSKGETDPKDPPPIDKFHTLIGNLYGVVGLAHAADCYLGDSQLLVAAGAQPVQELPAAGQGLVALWCAAGPIALAASKVGGVAADVGLIFYGLVEVAGAAILESQLPNLDGATVEIDPLTNAIVVQGVVVASRLYSKKKKGKD